MRKITSKVLVEKRFWTKVEKTEGCWLWMGALAHGYGRVKDGKKIVQAHRFAYELLRGPIPDGLQIDHLCRIPNCVNPEHMEPVTMSENLRRGVHFERNRTHCPQGHPYDELNTRHTSRGDRICRACERERYHRRKAS